MKIVLDTNCLIQSIPKRSRYHDVWVSFENGTNTLCISTEILEEYVEILQRLVGNSAADIILKSIINSPFAEFITPYYRFNLIPADPDDNKFVDCAIAANARYVVTNDHHYDILASIPFPHVDIISLDDFLLTLHSNN